MLFWIPSPRGIRTAERGEAVPMWFFIGVVAFFVGIFQALLRRK
nr:MAG TPA: hypothetical protein [Caudoviricetes sp.]